MIDQTEKRLVKKIWDETCDKILEGLTYKYHWDASYFIANALEEYFPKEKFEEFKQSCEKQNSHVWYNTLMYFADERIKKLGIEVRKPITKVCRYCSKEFLESSVRASISIKASYNAIFCGDCYDRVQLGGINIAAKQMERPSDEMLVILREFCEVIKIIPSSDFMLRPNFFALTEGEQLRAVDIYFKMPFYNIYVSTFGSWFKTLIQAGILADGTQRLIFGTRCLANDGHECASIAEKTIDDWLTRHSITHKKEPMYPYDEELNPTGKLRADWLIENELIEYAGLMSRKEYSKKIATKQLLAKKYEIQLLILTAKDILNLDNKLEVLLQK